MTTSTGSGYSCSESDKAYRSIGNMGKGERILEGETEHGKPDEKAAYLEPTRTRYTTYVWLYQW